MTKEKWYIHLYQTTKFKQFKESELIMFSRKQVKLEIGNKKNKRKGINLNKEDSEPKDLRELILDAAKESKKYRKSRRK